jgi:hypothetical protein
MKTDISRRVAMNKDPAFLFYSSDFLTGCIDLTMEERGQYITLICLQHQKGHLAEKTIRLSVGNVSEDVLKKFNKDENGLLFNKRIEEEIEKRRVFAESRRKNGQQGGRPKKPLGLPSEKPLGLPSENLPENENENENEKETEYAFKGKVIKLNREVYNEWKERFNLLDFDYELEQKDIWFSGQENTKNWFTRTQQHFLSIQREKEKAREEERRLLSSWWRE